MVLASQVAIGFAGFVITFVEAELLFAPHPLFFVWLSKHDV
jgi:hypothetical protein